MTHSNSSARSDWKGWETCAKVAVALWLIAQVALIATFWNVEQHSDQGKYLATADFCFNIGEWYPSPSHIHDHYIWAPGLINLLILELKIFGTMKVNYVLNLLLNCLILWNIWYIARRFFSRRTAEIAVVLFCLMYSNIMVVLPAGTEIPFLAAALSAFSLVVSNNKYRTGKLLLAGACLALANWVRPVAAVFLVVILLYMLLNKARIGNYAALMAPLIVLTLCFGWMAKRNTGYFTFQSTTSDVNLIMTANDRAYGGVATSLVDDTTSTCHIKDEWQYTYVQRDSIWRHRALDWIMEHPARYAGLYVVKLGGLYVEDSWPERPILGGSGFVDSAA